MDKLSACNTEIILRTKYGYTVTLKQCLRGMKYDLKSGAKFDLHLSRWKSHSICHLKDVSQEEYKETNPAGFVTLSGETVKSQRRLG